VYTWKRLDSWCPESIRHVSS